MWARQARPREGEKQVATRSNRRRKSLESSNVIIINLHAFQYQGKPRFILIIVHFFSYSRSTLIGGRGLQEGEGDGEGGSLDRELRARGQRQPDLLDVGRDDDDDAASGDGDCDHLCEICRVHGHDPGEAGRPGEGQPDA